MNNEIKTKELIRTSQSWDGVQLPEFPQGKPELTVLRMTFPIGAVTGWHHHTAVNYGIVEQGGVGRSGRHYPSRREPWQEACYPQHVLLRRTRSSTNHPTSGDSIIMTRKETIIIG